MKQTDTEQRNKTLDYWFLFCLAAVAVVLSAVYLLYLKHDTDLLWHYKLGEQIVRTGKISKENTFTWQKGTVWNQQEWLFDVLFYEIIFRTGIPGFVFSYAVLMLFGAWICCRIAKPGNRYLFLLMYGICFAWGETGGRPGDSSVFLFLIFLVLYEKALRLRTKLPCMAGLGIFMANYHAGNIMVMAAAWALLMFTDWLLDLREKKVHGTRICHDLLCLALFCASSCISPIGGYGLAFAAKHVLGTQSTKYISEWQPLPCYLPIAVIYCLILVTIGWKIAGTDFERTVFRRCVLCTGFCAASLASRRCVPLFLYSWLIFCSSYTYEMILSFAKAQGGQLLPSWRIRHRGAATAAAAAATVVIGGACASGTILCVQKVPTFAAYADAYASKPILVEILRASKADSRIFAPYYINNVILYHDISVTLDSRQIPYDSESNHSIMDYFNASIGSAEECRSYVAKYDFDYIWTDDQWTLMDAALENSPHYEKVLVDPDMDQTLWRKVK